MRYRYIHKKQNWLGWLFAMVVIASGAVSCRDEQLLYYDFEESDEGIAVTLPVSMAVAPLISDDAETRGEEKYIEATPDEKKIIDFWIIEYNEVGTRVGKPRYFEVDPDKSTDQFDSISKNMNIIVPRVDEQEYTCVVIANTHDSELFRADNRSKFSTLDSLRNFDIDVHNQEDLYDPHPTDEHEKRYLLMSGWTKIKKTSRHLHFDLIRNICKINVRLSAFTEKDLIIKYFQWVDVPFGKVFPHGTNVNYHERVSRDWRMHNEKETIAELRSEEGITYWLPTNVWLPDDPNDQSGKTEVEEDPTHFDIVCRQNVGSGSEDDDAILPEDLYEFRVYPSKDAGKQFRFEPNHFYHIDIEISEVPEVENAFYKKAESNVLPIANSYMLTRDTKGIYIVPIQRINLYWEQEDKTMKLGKEDRWVAEVIWQDTDQRIIDFALYSLGEIPEDRSLFYGAGNSYFVLRTTGTGEGNVVVGLRRRLPGDDPDSGEELPSPDEREYLWSWHLWVTDYNPNEVDFEACDAEEYPIVEVPGGILFPFDSSTWVMDRNIGATKPIFTSREDLWETYGLTYQYGRKDPFPWPNADERKVYDIDGHPIEAFNSLKVSTSEGLQTITMRTMEATTQSIQQSVRFPYRFVTGDPGGEGDEMQMWELGNDIMETGGDDGGRIWLSPDWYLDYIFSSEVDLGNEYDRSLYDPCPPGWVILDGVPDVDEGFWRLHNMSGEPWNIPGILDDNGKGKIAGLKLSAYEQDFLMPIGYCRKYADATYDVGVYWFAKGDPMSVKDGGLKGTESAFFEELAYGTAGQVRCCRKIE